MSIQYGILTENQLQTVIQNPLEKTESITEREIFMQKIAQILQNKSKSQKLDPKQIDYLLKATETLPFFSRMKHKQSYIKYKIHESCMQKLQYHKFNQGDILFSTGDISDKLYLILTGKICIFNTKSLEKIKEERIISEKHHSEYILTLENHPNHDIFPNYIYITNIPTVNPNEDNASCYYYNKAYKLDEDLSYSSSGLSIDEEKINEIIYDNDDFNRLSNIKSTTIPAITTTSNTTTSNTYITLNSKLESDNNDISKLKILTKMLGGISPYSINQLDRLITDNILNIEYKVTISNGKLFGTIGLLKQKLRKYTAICYENCEIAILSKSDYQDICNDMIEKRRREKTNFIWNTTFPEMTKQDADKMAKIVKKYKFMKGHKIYREGHESNGFYILKHGEIQLMQKLIIKDEINYGCYALEEYDSKKNKRHQMNKIKTNIVSKIEEGQFFGEEEFIYNLPRYYTASVASKFATLYFLPGDKLKEFFIENPKIKAFLKEKSQAKYFWHKAQEENQRNVATLQYQNIEDRLKHNEKSFQKESEFTSKEQLILHKKTSSPEIFFFNLNQSNNAVDSHLLANYNFIDSEKNNENILDHPKISLIMPSEKSTRLETKSQNHQRCPSLKYSNIEEYIHNDISKSNIRSLILNKPLKDVSNNPLFKSEKQSEFESNNAIGYKKLGGIGDIVLIKEKTFNQLNKHNSQNLNMLENLIEPRNTKSTGKERSSTSNSTNTNNNSQTELSLPFLLAKKIEKLTIKRLARRKSFGNVKTSCHIPKGCANANQVSISSNNPHQSFQMDSDWNKYTSKAIMSAISKPRNSCNTNNVAIPPRESISQEGKVSSLSIETRDKPRQMTIKPEKNRRLSANEFEKPDQELSKISLQLLLGNQHLTNDKISTKNSEDEKFELRTIQKRSIDLTSKLEKIKKINIPKSSSNDLNKLIVKRENM